MRAAGFFLAVLVLSGCTTTEGGPEGGSFGQKMQNSLNNFGKGIETSVNANFSGEDIVRGRILIRSPIYGYYTCFKDIENGYVSRYPIDNPAQAEGTPGMIMTREGDVGSGRCSEWEKKGLLVMNTSQGQARQDQAAYGDDCGGIFDGLKPGDRAIACDAHKTNQVLGDVYFPKQQSNAAQVQQINANASAGFADIQAQVERDKQAAQAQLKAAQSKGN